MILAISIFNPNISIKTSSFIDFMTNLELKACKYHSKYPFLWSKSKNSFKFPSEIAKIFQNYFKISIFH